MTAKEIFEQLNLTDELDDIEAKPGTAISHSVMETVCAFANEPGMGGGYILLGAVKDHSSLFPQYVVHAISDPDKIQSDFATQCASRFNIPIRPEIKIDQINGDNVAVINVNELPTNQKPLYFKSEGLPKGAYRRIGPTDHRCTEDDMPVFYTDRKTYDQSTLDATSFEDIDEIALKRYRILREKLNPAAEELTYNDFELLQSLGCLETGEKQRLTVAGLLLFGKSTSLRRTMPMMRADYIRVPGNEWIEDPDDRFSTIDMRGPLILLVFRIVDAIFADLPKTFRLEDDDLQADSIGMPVKALREAVTNALMHRSYRVHSPLQIIRYDNRLEILNPGFSLKSEEKLGSPGSETRNPFIAAVFHETNLAETKGSGIRAMRRLLTASHLAPPTFESNRVENKFTARLLLHHFLSRDDLNWLSNFESFDLNDNQKSALIFVREMGAVDNLSYRQLTNLDTLKASNDLRRLRDSGLLLQKGKGRGTYYLPGNLLNTHGDVTNIRRDVTNTHGDVTNTHGDVTNTYGDVTNTHGDVANTEGDDANRKGIGRTPIPKELSQQLENIRKREDDKDKVKQFIVELCNWKAHTLTEISTLLDKKDNYVSREYVKPLINEGYLNYTKPEMVHHPDQAYRGIRKWRR